MLINSAGIIIRMHVSNISQIGRITSGVKLITLEKDVKIASIASVLEEDLDDETPPETP